MKMYRCRICGETYLGYEPPANCPFCGAHVDMLVDPRGYDAAINDIDPTEVERADLDTSIETERSNTRFYLAMAQRCDNDSLRSAYKRLANIEAEHCSLFCKLAKVAKPADLRDPGTELGGWSEDIEESLRREKRASALYTQFAARATSPRLIEVWTTVAGIETDHIALDEVAKTYV